MIYAVALLCTVGGLALGAIIERRANSKRFVPINEAPDREPRR